MRKVIYGLVALLAFALLFAYVSLSTMGIEKLIVCATTGDVSRIPSPACMYYLDTFTDAEDGDQLGAGAGLAYAFGVPADNTR